MNKVTGLIIAIVFVVVMVFIYLQIGHKGVTAAKTYVETQKGDIEQAQKSMDEMNKSVEESKKAADRMMGK